MKIAFHSYQLGERGTEVCLYKYAKYNREILGNESIIVSTSSRPTPTFERFNSEFKTLLYPDVWVNNGKNDGLRQTLEKIVSEEGVDVFYAIKGGESDGILPKNCKSVAHAVFRTDDPHGDVYAGVCKYIVDKHGSKHPFVDHIVEKTEPTENLREKLNIPSDAFVFGRHGGSDTFSIPFVKEVVRSALATRKDAYFLFLNTEKFIEHERVIHIPWTKDLVEISNFVNTCDAMLHARMEGEVFPLVVAEFSTQNKPVITWDGHSPIYDRGHIEILKDKGIYYRNPQDLFTILINLNKDDIKNIDWDVYKDNYSPSKVMDQFKRIFL